MTKFNDFLNEDKPSEKDLENMQKVNGVYGCQMCEKYSYLAYFNESTGKMMWFCEDGHKSGFSVQ